MLNLNVGVLGHVDSGKTTIARALSQISSTAAFDKSPQSQERGITLDLGFSSFNIPVPHHLKNALPESINVIQFTLVDCPGHASLIRTVIGGAQIIDMMLLVIDATKGIQTQTAECLIIGELTCRKMIVVVNKTDLLIENKEKSIEKICKRLRTQLSSTIFRESPFVFIAASPGGNGLPEGMDELVRTISEFAFIPERGKTSQSDFLFAADHCFGIKGQGTVLTGTILQGSVQINDNIYIPSQKLTRKVKSMQMFHKPVERAVQGDRVGICVTQFDPKLFERGVVCAPEPNCCVNETYAVVIKANKIKYFTWPIKNKMKFHISVGYATVMATVTCFSKISESFPTGEVDGFDFDAEYKYCEELPEEETRVYMLLEFEKPTLTFAKCLVIGSKLDATPTSQQPKVCRLAFWGKALATTKDKEWRTTFLPQLKVFKNKVKSGTVERVHGENELIVKGMFEKKDQAYVQRFTGLQVTLSTGAQGWVEGPFGQSGKIKVVVNGLTQEALNLLKHHTLANKKQNTELTEPVKVTLEFKRYLYDNAKKIVQ